MAYFNPNRETKLILDRSTRTGFSSILTQLDPEMQQHQAVYYESRSTTLQEQRYSVYLYKVLLSNLESAIVISNCVEY